MQNFQPAEPEDWRKWDPLAKFNTPSHSTGTVLLLLKHIGRKSRSKDVWNWSCDLAAAACPYRYQKYWLPFSLSSFQVTAPHILTDSCYYIMSEQSTIRGSRRRMFCGAVYLIKKKYHYIFFLRNVFSLNNTELQFFCNRWKLWQCLSLI